VFVVIDNSAKSGSGTTACEPLHRIDERTTSADTRDWNADPDKDPRTHTQDLFALKFVKP
jgi:predicted methyltransferase